MKPQENLNLDNYWLPFTANKNFKANPRLLTSANGMYYKTDDGKDAEHRPRRQVKQPQQGNQYRCQRITDADDQVRLSVIVGQISATEDAGHDSTDHDGDKQDVALHHITIARYITGNCAHRVAL